MLFTSASVVVIGGVEHGLSYDQDSCMTD